MNRILQQFISALSVLMLPVSAVSLQCRLTKAGYSHDVLAPITNCQALAARLREFPHEIDFDPHRLSAEQFKTTEGMYSKPPPSDHTYIYRTFIVILAILSIAPALLRVHEIALATGIAAGVLVAYSIQHDLRKMHAVVHLPYKAIGLSKDRFRSAIEHFSFHRIALYPMTMALSLKFFPVASLNSLTTRALVLALLNAIFQRIVVLPVFKMLVYHIDETTLLIRSRPNKREVYLTRSNHAQEGSALRNQGRGIDEREVRAIGLEWVFVGGRLRQSFVFWYEEPYLLCWTGLLFPMIFYIVPTRNWRPWPGRHRLSGSGPNRPIANSRVLLHAA